MSSVPSSRPSPARPAARPAPLSSGAASDAGAESPDASGRARGTLARNAPRDGTGAAGESTRPASTPPVVVDSAELDDVPAWNGVEGGSDGTERLPKRLEVYVFPHTHQDRAWWDTVDGVRQLLVENVDGILETLDRDPEYRAFFGDAQLSFVTDYLAIRKKMTEKVVRYVNEGRLQVGPWYIQPDQALISGEAHVRNVEYARRVARELGIRPEVLQRIAYIPDAFGQISQMPQVAAQLGLHDAMLWRGFGGTPEEVQTEMWWEAPDGTRVLAHTYAGGEGAEGGKGESGGYYRQALREWDTRPYYRTRGRLRDSLRQTAPYTTTHLALEGYGGDLRPHDPALPRTIALANEDLDGESVIHWGMPSEYFARIRELAPELGTLHGELRATGPGKPYLLPGVLSSRMYLKQLNFEAQRKLERYAEPLSALAWKEGGHYDDDFLWDAWKKLLQTMPHDNICGCSIDEVHRESIPLTERAARIAERQAEISMRYLASKVDTSALSDGEFAVVLHNPLPQSRTDFAKVSVPSRWEVSPKTHVLTRLSSDGGPEEEVPFQVRDVSENRPGVRAADQKEPWLHPQKDLCFVAPDVPGFGHQTYRLRKRGPGDSPARSVQFTQLPAGPAGKSGDVVTDVKLGANTLENAFLKVDVDPSTGTFSVTDKRTGEIYEGLGELLDGGDAGDTYNYGAPLNDTVLSSKAPGAAKVTVQVAEKGYASAALKIRVTWELPEGLTEDEDARSHTRVPTTFETTVRLHSESTRVDLETEWENVTRDHRLQMAFPLGAKVSRSFAEGQFDVVERPVGLPESVEGFKELPVDTHPQQGFVSVTADDAGGESGAAKKGLTVVNEGLPEYRVAEDGTVRVTLLRSVGWLSRENGPARLGGAGTNTPTPDAQCLGPQKVKLSLVPHQGTWLEAGAAEAAAQALTPLVGVTTDRHEGDLPPTSGLIRIEGESSGEEGDHTFSFSSLRRTEDEGGLSLRLWNHGKEATSARVHLRERPSSVTMVDLEGNPLEEGGALPIAEDGSFVVPGAPARIVTLDIRF